MSARDADPTPTRWSREHWALTALMLIPAGAIALARWHALPSASFLAHQLSLAATPGPLQHTVKDILFVPIGALIVVIFRLTLGIRVLGPFRSILLAFAFLATGVTVGIVFLTLTILILLLARPAIRALRLPYFGRVSVMISAVALVMTVGTLSAGWLGSPSLRNVAHFPIVVLVLVGEKVAQTINREGLRSGISRATSTALVGIVVTAVASLPGLDRILLSHPELLLVEIWLIVTVSTLCSWRLLASLTSAPDDRSRPEQAPPRRTTPELAGASQP
jgi:7 transmembrane helices usually fused to an inactive transglutaminase